MIYPMYTQLEFSNGNIVFSENISLSSQMPCFSFRNKWKSMKKLWKISTCRVNKKNEVCNVSLLLFTISSKGVLNTVL